MVQCGLLNFRPTKVTLTHENKNSGTRSKENSDVAAGLPVPMGDDCVYDSACNSSSPFDFE